MHTTTLKEKTMAPVSRYIQTSFSTAVLRSAALAIALIVPASPAHSETLDLSGANTRESGGGIPLHVYTDRRNITAVADFANWPVVITSPSGGDTRYHITTISDQFIKFTEKRTGSTDNLIGEGTLDRIAGTLHLKDFFDLTVPSDWACRRATKKF